VLKKTVIVVRHAQSEHHVKRLSGGWTDTPITELGHQQAHLVAQRLARELDGVPVRLFTSDLLRTRDTASHIAEALGVEPVADARLREFNNGEAAGLTIDELLRRFPEAPQPWGADHRQWPGGETWREFYARAGDFIDTLDFEGPLPILVTHGGTVMALVARWLRLTPEVMQPIGFSADVTGLTVLQVDAHGWRRIERLNDIGHLAGHEGHVPLSAAR
jgi:broad specificity phosphatase PhoE